MTRYFEGATSAPARIDGSPTAAPSIATISGFDPSKCHYWKGVKGPTMSWWLLFLGVRQMITLGLARGSQFFIIYYALKINFSGLMGPTIRLFLLQAKGWPFVLVRCVTIHHVAPQNIAACSYSFHLSYRFFGRCSTLRYYLDHDDSRSIGCTIKSG